MVTRVKGACSWVEKLHQRTKSVRANTKITSRNTMSQRHNVLINQKGFSRKIPVNNRVMEIGNLYRNRLSRNLATATFEPDSPIHIERVCAYCEYWSFQIFTNIYDYWITCQRILNSQRTSGITLQNRALYSCMHLSGDSYEWTTCPICRYAALRQYDDDHNNATRERGRI